MRLRPIEIAPHCGGAATKRSDSGDNTWPGQLGPAKLQLHELSDARRVAPLAEALGFGAQLALAIEQLVGDRAHTGRILERHPVRSFEIEEFRRRRRMAAGAEGDVHPALPQESKRAHDVVAGLNLVIDVLDA